MKPKALVIVHGVGATKRGAILRQLVGELSGPIGEHEVGDRSYPRAELADQDFAEAYEAYWADLKLGGDGLVARALRVFDVLIGLSRIGGWGWSAEPIGVNERSFFGRVLHVLLWSVVVALPCVFLPLLYVDVLRGGWGLAGAAAAVTPTIALAIYLGRHDRLCWIAAALGAVAAPTTAWMAWTNAISVAGGAALTAKLVSGSQVIVITFTSLACIELAIKAVRAKQRPSVAAALVRFAALSLPFTIIGGVIGSLTWAINLSALSKWGNDPLLHLWGAAYQRALRYDLALLELAFATTTLAFLLFVGGVFSVFLVRLRFGAAPVECPKGAAEEQRDDAGTVAGIGQRARDGLLASLWVLCLGGTAIGTLYLVNFWLFPQEAILQVRPLGAARDWFLSLARVVAKTKEKELDVFAIYLASAARVAGFLPWLLKPVRSGAVLAADVVLFLVPDEHMSYRVRARQSLTNLLVTLERDHEVYLLAHSQGTVVALDALDHSEARPVLLITAGSPIDALYERFLAVGCRRPPQLVRWRNFYRPSDYIGGPVARADRECQRIVSDYRDNHLNYFHDRKIMGLLRAEAAPASA